jgi:hydrogenase small subunit
VETTADTLGAYLAAAAAGGIAVHAVATNLRKRRLIKKELETSLKDKNLKPGEKNE